GYYADKRINVSNGEKQYRQYIINRLRIEGFFLIKERYWVNRFWRTLDELLNKKFEDLIIEMKI
ncbi:hypothetical protein NSB04_21220, partial [Blautia pseudococcoides]|nr:hypothetical protein [Blautia pseudococcoides]